MGWWYGRPARLLRLTDTSSSKTLADKSVRSTQRHISFCQSPLRTCSIDIPVPQEALMATDTLTAPVIMGTATRPKVYRNFIDGEWVEASTGETFENRNPADTRDVVGFFQKSAKADVDAAVEAAKRAFAKWRLVPAPRRAAMVYRAAEMLLERKEEYARDMTREMGKVLKETRGDVQEAIDTAYYMAAGGRPKLWR